MTFAEAREHLGAGQARNRTRNAVERTTPFALYCYTIVVAWYALHGHQPSDVADPGTPPKRSLRSPTWPPSSAA